MADNLTIQSNALEVLRKFDRLPNEIQTSVRKGFARGLLLVEEEVKRRADVRLTGARSGLASRLTSYVQVKVGDLAVDGVIGFRKTAGFPYELAQEFGAHARPGGAMAIPVSDEAKALASRGVSAKDFPRELFVPGRTHVLAENLGLESFRSGNGMLTVHYVLVKSIPPRLHFRESVEDNLDVVWREVMEAWEER